MKQIEKLTLKFLDGELSPREQVVLEQLIASSAEAKAIHLGLLEQEGALRALRPLPDQSEATLQQLRGEGPARTPDVVERVMREVRGADEAEDAAPASTGIRALPPVERDRAWLLGAPFWKVAAAVLLVVGGLLAARTAHLYSRSPATLEAFVYGQWVAAPGLETAFRVLVRDGESGAGIPDAAVRLVLKTREGVEVWSQATQTGPHGVVVATAALPATLAEGTYTLAVEAGASEGEATVTQRFQVRRSHRVLVTTDKPLYQPGHTVHIRTLALSTSDRRPAEERPVLIEVRDGKGNKVFKQTEILSSYGIASADFRLADQVNQGRYTISATVGDATSERAVRVERYVLPKFKVELTTERRWYAPGETVRGEVACRYTFGEPVAGARVRLVAAEMIEQLRPFQEVAGTTNAEGRFAFTLRLKDRHYGLPFKQGDGLVAFEVAVTDAAGHAQERTLERTITTAPIRIDAVPESGRFVPGHENLVYVVTSYPDGTPARAKLEIAQRDGSRLSVETDAGGLAQVKLTRANWLRVTARDASGTRSARQIQLQVDEAPPDQAILLRTDRAVYRAGETVQLTALTRTRGGAQRLFVDVVHDGQTVLMKALDAKDGKAELALDLPRDLGGTVAISAYRLTRDAGVVSDTKLVSVTQGSDLTIAASLDRASYLPGGQAVLDLLVQRDGQGVPAALSLVGVDEAVYALQESRPGLERVYFALQEELLEPRYAIYGRLPPHDALLEPGADEPGAALLLAAARDDGVPGRAQGESFSDRLERLRIARKDELKTVKAISALVPTALAYLLLLALPLYAVARAFKRQPVDPKLAPEPDVHALVVDVRYAIGWWLLGLVGPWLAAIAAEMLLRGSLRRALAPGCAILITLVAAVLLAHRVWLLYHDRILEAAPLLRRLVLALPLTYVLSVVAFVALVAVSGSYPRSLDDDVGIPLALGLLAVGLLTVPALAVSVRAVFERMELKRYVWVAFSRSAPAALPLMLMFCLSFMSVAGGARMKAASMPDGMEIMGGEDGPWTDAPSDAGSDAPDGGQLRAPSRIRRHFPETLLWLPEVIADSDGRARVEVPLADSITTWRIGMSAVSREGQLGSTTVPLKVFQDFFCDLDLPVALTQHDRVTVPVALYNYLDRAQTVRLELQPADWYRTDGLTSKSVTLQAGEVTSVTFPLVALRPGSHALQVKAFGSQMADAVERIVRVEPDGRRVVRTINGSLGDRLTQEIEIPAGAIEGASDLVLKVYPGRFSQVVEGMDSIFHMPHGCFEQTSSTTYPNVLVLDYLRTTGQARPEIELKALDYINVGNQRLLSFEVDGGGFEWFGRSPAHPVLTAYGLMEFLDMAQVSEVDPDVIARTREWLLDRQRRDHTWAVPGRTWSRVSDDSLKVTAYVAWALAQAGEPDQRLTRSLDWIETAAESADDPYTLALCANALLAGERNAAPVLGRLHELTLASGKTAHWGARQGESLTYGRGDTLAIETTALVAAAYLRSGYQHPTAMKALAWLVEQKDPRGTWGSTQATVLAMRALLAGSGQGSSIEADVDLTVSLDGALAHEETITPDTSDVYRLISLRELVHAGANTVALEATGDGTLAYQLVATHYIPWTGERPRERRPELDIEVDYSTRELATDDLLTCKVTVTYDRPGVANMTIVDLGLPPGFEVIRDGFEELRSRGAIERYTLTPRQAILYFRQLTGGRPVSFSYRLRARYPLEVQTPTSSVYQYYEPALRDETEPVRLRVR